jgi:hypothetical protein
VSPAKKDKDAQELTEAYEEHPKDTADLNQDYGVEPGETQNPEMHPEAQYSQLVSGNDSGVVDAAVGGDAGPDLPPDPVPGDDSVQARMNESPDLNLEVGDDPKVNPDEALEKDLDQEFAKADELADTARKKREEADEAEREARKAREHLEDEIGGYRPRCPHDGERLLHHEGDDPIKAKSWHCNTCGCCWAPGIREIRVGTPICNRAPVMQDGTVVTQRP